MWVSGKRASIGAFDRNALFLCILAPQNCFQTSWEVGGTCQTRVLCSFLLEFHALKFSNYYLFIFQILGLIFPPVSNCIISACHFHILFLYKESPQIIAFSLWCFCFMLVLWSHVWHIEIVSCSLLFLFLDICYCDLALLQFEMGKLSVFLFCSSPLWEAIVWWKYQSNICGKIILWTVIFIPRKFGKPTWSAFAFSFPLKQWLHMNAIYSFKICKTKYEVHSS